MQRALLPLLFVVLLFSCKKDKDDTPAELETILTSQALVIMPQNQGDILSVDDTHVVLKSGTTNAEMAAVGSVLASGITSAAPYGFLRKVLSKEVVGGNIVLTTEPTSLDELFEQADINFHTTISPSDSMMRTTGPGFDWTLQEVVLYDHDQNLATTDDQIKGSGAVKFEITGHNFVYKKKKGSLYPEEALITFDVADKSNIRINATLLSVGNGTPKVFKTWPLKPLVISVPILGVPVPVLIFKNELVLKGKANATGKVVYNYTNNVTYKMGVRYENGVWNSVNESTLNGSGDKPVRQNFNAQAEASMLIMLDVVSKPYNMDFFKTEIGCSLGLKGTVDTAKDPDYFFGLIGDIHANASTTFFSKALTGNFSASKEFPIWEITKGNFDEFSVIGKWNAKTITILGNPPKNGFDFTEIWPETCNGNTYNLIYRYTREYLKFNFTTDTTYTLNDKGLNYRDELNMSTCTVNNIQEPYDVSYSYKYTIQGNNGNIQLPSSTGPYNTPFKMTVINSSSIKMEFTDDGMEIVFEKE